MGYGTALGLASSVGTLCDIDQALRIHLLSNHYPPLPLSLIPTCKAAIDACNDEDYDCEIELPAGISYKGLTSAPAFACADAWHLQAFIDHIREYTPALVDELLLQE